MQYMANSKCPIRIPAIDDTGKPCPKAPYYPGLPGYRPGRNQNLYGPGRSQNPCDFNHFWSFHLNGANFVFGDGSVPVRALHSQAGNEHPHHPSWRRHRRCQ